MEEKANTPPLEAKPQPVEEPQSALPQPEVKPEQREKTPVEAVQEKSPTAAEIPVKEPYHPPATPQAEALPLKTKPEGLFAKIFNKETRFGRFNKALLRWLVIILGLFALGLVAAYFQLVKPLRAELDTTRTSLQDTQAELETAQTKLADLQQEKDALDEEYALSEDALSLANNQVTYLVIKSEILKARLALKNSAGGPEALEALKLAQENLEQLVPFIQEQDPNLADLLRSRLEVAVAEVKRDPVEAPEAVDDAYTRLLDLEEFLFE